MQQDQFKHGFTVAGMGGDGKPSIFLHSFFPTQIVKVEPLSRNGSTITVKYNEVADPVKWNVMPSVKEVEAYVKECERLDREVTCVTSHGAVKGGNRIE